jgi:integrase
VRDAFARVVRAAALPHFTPHSLRHTYASLLLVAGLDVYYVSRMLGHASIQETVDTYGRWLPANRPGVLDVLDRETPVTSTEAGAL